MDETKALKRRIFLKGQALKLIRAEREELKQRLSLISVREILLKRVDEGFDPVVSQKLDCVDFILRT